MASFLAYLKPIRDRFYKENDPDLAYQELQPYMRQFRQSPEEKRAVYELAGLILRDRQRFDEAIKVYNAIDDPFQAGYCEMLKGDLGATRNYWSKVTEERQNHWCVALFGLVCRQLMAYPTPFQVRNHLESDIHNLIRATQFILLENLLSHADMLVQVNPETYKFIGRSLMHSGWLDRAGPYLLKGQKMLPNDPEIYFHLGQYSEKRGLYDDARVLLHQCLLISPTYNPAKDILEGLPPN